MLATYFKLSTVRRLEQSAKGLLSRVQTSTVGPAQRDWYINPRQSLLRPAFATPFSM